MCVLAAAYCFVIGPGELDSKKDSVKSLVHAHVVRLQAAKCAEECYIYVTYVTYVAYVTYVT